jgi:hypothetical protein
VKLEWFQKEGVKPIYEFGADGQYFRRVYARPRANEWEYVLALYSDDGILIEYTRLYKGEEGY